MADFIGQIEEGAAPDAGSLAIAAKSIAISLKRIADGMEPRGATGTLSDLAWLPIGRAPPGRYVLLRGPSGYRGTPYRYVVARFDKDYRPLQPWVTAAGDSVLDSGEMPTHYAELGT